MVIRIFTNKMKSENGFVLVAAILAVMIILALSFFILTTSTQDIRISGRLVGERKAMSAAEYGAQAIYALSADLPTLALNTTNCPGTTHLPPCYYDDNDNHLSYTFTTQVVDRADTAGYDLSTVGTSPIYETIVTGTDSTYDSSASIAIGMKPPAGKSGTGQGPIGAGGG